MRDRIMLGVSILGFISLSWLCLARNGGLLAADAPIATGPLPTLAVRWSPQNVSLEGVVPDSAVAARVRARVESLSGLANITGSLETGERAASEDWLTAALEAISATRMRLDEGELRVDGTTATLGGEVADDDDRGAAMDALRQALGSGYVVTDALTIGTAAKSRKLQRLVSERLTASPLQFAAGGSSLTPASRQALTELVADLNRVPDVEVEIRAASEATGRARSLADSRARALRSTLVSLGIDGNRVAVAGQAGAPNSRAVAPGKPRIAIAVELDPELGR